MKADKRQIEMRCRDYLELSTALKRRSVDEFVAVEFGSVDNMGDNQFRYKYSLHCPRIKIDIILARITKNSFIHD